MGRLQGADEFGGELAARDVTCLLVMGKHAIDQTRLSRSSWNFGDGGPVVMVTQ
jgi:hypothetical protein